MNIIRILEQAVDPITGEDAYRHVSAYRVGADILEPPYGETPIHHQWAQVSMINDIEVLEYGQYINHKFMTDVDRYFKKHFLADTVRPWTRKAKDALSVLPGDNT